MYDFEPIYVNEALLELDGLAWTFLVEDQQQSQDGNNSGGNGNNSGNNQDKKEEEKKDKEAKSFFEKLKQVPKYFAFKLPLKALMGETFYNRLEECLEKTEDETLKGCKLVVGKFAVSMFKDNKTIRDKIEKGEKVTKDELKEALKKAFEEALVDCEKKDGVTKEARAEALVNCIDESGKLESIADELTKSGKWIRRTIMIWLQYRWVRVTVKAAFVIATYAAVAMVVKRMYNISFWQALDPRVVARGVLEYIRDPNRHIAKKIALIGLIGLFIGSVLTLTVTEAIPAIKALFEKKEDEKKEGEKKEGEKKEGEKKEVKSESAYWYYGFDPDFVDPYVVF